MKFIEKIRQEIKRDLFSQEDLKMLMSDVSDASLHSAITRALKSKEMIKLKRGLYLFEERLRRHSISHFSVANRIYSPSYISFESALSYHGLIPEAVYTTTSACFQRKSKKFHNILGDFTFDYIPVTPFFKGVESLEEKNGALVANPIRALFDLLYVRRISYRNLSVLEEDLRITRDDLGKKVSCFSFAEIEELAQSYKKKNISDFAQMLARSFK